jgi:ribosomal protein L35
VNRLFSTNLTRAFGDEGIGRGAWAPSVDIYENKDQIVLEAELPGMKQEDFDLSIENNVITLRGEQLPSRRTLLRGFYSFIYAASDRFRRRGSGGVQQRSFESHVTEARGSKISPHRDHRRQSLNVENDRYNAGYTKSQSFQRKLIQRGFGADSDAVWDARESAQLVFQKS